MELMILVLGVAFVFSYRCKSIGKVFRACIYGGILTFVICALCGESGNLFYDFFVARGFSKIDFHFIAAILLFLGSIAITYENRKNTSLSKISILLVGLFFSIVVLVFPMYDEYDNSFQRIVYSILYSVQCIYVGQDFEFLQNKILEHQAMPAYSLFINFLFLLAPIFTTGIILTLLEQFMHKLKYMIELLEPWKREIHIFSNINKESVTLAESIYNPKDILLFCNEKEDEIKESLKNRIRKIQAITIAASELELKMLNIFGKKVFFYEISKDDIKNMDNSMKLMESYQNNEKVKVTVFSIRKEAQMLLDSTNRKMRVALVNKNQYALYHLLEQRPVVKYSKNGKSSVLLIGEKNRVLEMIKMILWSMQLDGQELAIHVIDENAQELKSMFYHQCPGLKEDKYPVFFYQANSQTEEMDSVVDKYCQDVNYIILAMEEDRRNIETAIYLREHFLYLDKESYSNQPPIHIWLNDEIKGIESLGINDKNYVLSEADNKKITYGFYPFGTTEQIYSEVSILNTKLEEFALMMHLANVGALNAPPKEQEVAKRTYRNRENTRRYSITCAIHMKYSLYTKGVDLFGKEINKQLVEQVKTVMSYEENIQSLMRSDIRMWNTFWRTEGFRQVSFEEASVYYKSLQSHQHTIAKLNPCLTDLDEFEADEVALEKIRGKRPQLIKAERNYIMKFPMILERLCNEEKI